MRWFWVDRFEEFVSGQRARSVKNVALSEEHLDEYNVTWPYMPPPLMIEGLAQTGGLLLGQMSDFHARVVLAKVGKAKFEGFARPGDRVNYELELLSTHDEGAIAGGKISINESEVIGHVELVFAALDDEQFSGIELFEPHGFLRMLRIMRLFEVGVYPDGTPIKVPDHLLQAEHEYLATPNRT